MMNKKNLLTRSLHFLWPLLLCGVIGCSGLSPSTISPTPTAPAAPLRASAPTKIPAISCDQGVQYIQQGQVMNLTIFVTNPDNTLVTAQLTLTNRSLLAITPFTSICETRLRAAVQQKNQTLPTDQQIQISQQTVS